jgi:hypothetical protein
MFFLCCSRIIVQMVTSVGKYKDKPLYRNLNRLNLLDKSPSQVADGLPSLILIGT